jgi:hypothetical protein
MTDENPKVTPFLRLFTTLEGLVLIVAGIGLFLFPDLIRPIWPWTLPPFNAAFIGAIYLASVPAIGMMAFLGGWASSRHVLAMLMTFTGIGLIITLINLPRFNFQEWTTWVWIFLYVTLPVNSAVHLWLYRNVPVSRPTQLPAFWHIYFKAQGIILALYGLGQISVPEVFNAFWPWRIDQFHGQFYGGAFIAIGLGSWLVAKHAARIELFIQGITQICFGLLTISGLVIVDLFQHKVAWSTAGTWVWMISFAVIALAGAGTLQFWRRPDEAV